MPEDARRDTQATKPPESTDLPQKEVVARGSDKQLSKKTSAGTSTTKKSGTKKSQSKKSQSENDNTTTVAQVMADSVRSVQSTASLNEAARQMWDHDIGVVPVVDMEGRVTGLVTDRDIAMAAYLQGRLLQNLGVQEVMSTQIRTVRPYQSVSEAASIMAQHQVRRLPVVDDEGNLAGMLSLNDLAEASGSGKKAAVSEQEVAATLRAICAPHGEARKEATAS